MYAGQAGDATYWGCVIYGLKSAVVPLRICYLAWVVPCAASAMQVEKMFKECLGGPFLFHRATCTTSLRVSCPLGDSWEVGGVVNLFANNNCPLKAPRALTT